MILWGRVGPTSGRGSKFDIGLFKMFLGNRMSISDIISSCNKGGIIFDMRIFGESIRKYLIQDLFYYIVKICCIILHKADLIMAFVVHMNDLSQGLLFGFYGKIITVAT